MHQRPKRSCFSGYSSIFQTHEDDDVEDSEWNISDCSSPEPEELHQSQDNRSSPLHISDCSSDGQDTPNSNATRMNCSYVKQLPSTSFRGSMKSGSKRRMPTRRMPLRELQVKRRSTNSNFQIKESGVLTTNQSNYKKPNRSMSSAHSEIPHNFSARQSQLDLNETPIEWSSSSGEEDLRFESPSRSQTISAPSTSSQPPSAPTELDLFIALIERESEATKTPPASRKVRNKRYRKGGLLQELYRTLESSKADRKFLEHDKKYGLQSGCVLTVLAKEDSFGVHMATVETNEPEDNPNIFRVLIDATMAKQVQIGSKLEAFFSGSIEPYVGSGLSQESSPIYVQPHKLLLL